MSETRAFRLCQKHALEEISALCRRLGVTLNTLLGRKGSLEKMKDYWDVGFYLGANILSNEHRKVIDACEKLYKLKAPVW